MTPDVAKLTRAKWSTRISFFVAGFLIACWAPIVPFAKLNTQTNEAEFGILLFCLGLGSLAAMPLAGVLVGRHGAKPVVVFCALVAALVFPTLSFTGHSGLLALGLFAFGGSLGALDVAMNVHGSQVEQKSGKPLMSGFHAQFSLGALVGASISTALISSTNSAVISSSACALLAMSLISLTPRGFLKLQNAEISGFRMPRGIIIPIAFMTGVTFLVEGAVLEWGALLLIERTVATISNAGFGFVLFSIAMVLSRLAGGRVTAWLGEISTLILSCCVTVVGFAVVLTAPDLFTSGFGFFVIGLGAANVAPIMISKAGRQTIIPSGVAVASVTTIGYGGHMIGPAFVGMVAHTSSLVTAFWCLAALMCALAVLALVLRERWRKTSSPLEST